MLEIKEMKIDLRIAKDRSVPWWCLTRVREEGTLSFHVGKETRDD